MTAQHSAPNQKRPPRQHQQKTPEKQKLKPARSSPPHTKTRVIPKYPTNDRRPKTAEHIRQSPHPARPRAIPKPQAQTQP